MSSTYEGIFFTELDISKTSSRRNVKEVLSEEVVFISSNPATKSTGNSGVLWRVTGAQAARDTKSIIENARKRDRQ